MPSSLLQEIVSQVLTSEQRRVDEVQSDRHENEKAVVHIHDVECEVELVG